MVTERLFAIPQHGISTDDYYTPRWIFDALETQFDLDVAAPPGGISWLPASHYYTIEDDGLSQPWTGRVWMNPPYSNVTPWIHRFIDHGNGIGIVPLVRSKWLSRAWRQLDAIVIPDDLTIRFERPEGKPATISYPTAFVAMGATNSKAIEALGRVR